MNSDTTDIRYLIQKLVSNKNLSKIEIKHSVDLILQGKLSDASIASFLVALTMKGETSEEIYEILQAIKKFAIQITPKINGCLIDNCGTGGDNMRSFNISTAAAIVASAGGAKVAKHGNRSTTGNCGSADFLEHIGFNLGSPPEIVTKTIEEDGIGFLYAQMFHPALFHAASARKTIGIRTIFNIIGPLCNPCTNICGQVIGVFEPMLLDTLSKVMQSSDRNEIMIVHSHDGFDELSNTSENDIIWVSNGHTKRIVLRPHDLNLRVARAEDLIATTREDSIRDTFQVIYGSADFVKEDIVVLNASAALIVGGITKDFKEGIDIARSAIKDGIASKKLSELIRRCGNVEKLEAAEKKYL
jgi:anthranilate phosphoribosyltransferase